MANSGDEQRCGNGNGDGGHHSSSVLSSKEHSLKVLRGLNNLRQSSKFCDVEIAVGKECFRAHRAVLSASSDYFMAMFTSGLAEETLAKVDLKFMEPKIFEAILGFVYTGTLAITQDNAQDLLEVADMLQLSEVVTACAAFLVQQLHHSNCLGIYRFAEAHNCEDLKLRAESFTLQNFIDVAQSEEFLAVPADILRRLLPSDQLRIDNEVQVFEGVMSWMFHDLTNRRRFFFDLLDDIRLSLIPDAFLNTYTQECKDIILKVALSKLLQDHRVNRIGPSQINRRALPRTSARKRIYLVGGYKREKDSRWHQNVTLSSLECYHSFTGQWLERAPLQLARFGLGVAVLDGCIYVVGGENSDSMIFDSGETYDPVQNKWSSIRCMTMPRSQLSLVALNGCLYALGGWVGATVTTSVERYDPAAREWVKCGHMPSSRCAMGAVAHEGLIYVIGGLSGLNLVLDTVESLNPVTNEWNTLSSLPVAMAHVSAVVVNDKIYAVGSYLSKERLQRYSFDDNQWDELIIPLSRLRCDPCLAVANGTLFIIGGRTFKGGEFSHPLTLQNVDSCNLEASNASWKSVAPIKISRCEAGVAVI